MGNTSMKDEIAKEVEKIEQAKIGDFGIRVIKRSGNSMFCGCLLCDLFSAKLPTFVIDYLVKTRVGPPHIPPYFEKRANQEFKSIREAVEDGWRLY